MTITSRSISRFISVASKALLLAGFLLLMTTQAHASKRWTYCSVNSPSDLWVTKVFEHEWDGGGAEDAKAEFARLVREQYPEVKPGYMPTMTCVTAAGEFDGFDKVQMTRVRNRDLKSYSAVHEVRMDS